MVKCVAIVAPLRQLRTIPQGGLNELSKLKNLKDRSFADVFRPPEKYFVKKSPCLWPYVVQIHIMSQPKIYGKDKHIWK